MDVDTMERLLHHRISTDTRLLEKDDVFFAFPGKNYDAHDFIGEALEKGVSHFVVSDRKKVRPEWLKRSDFVFVEDTLTAYGDLAAYWRRKFRIPAVVVTGSAGKTTVKELLAHLLSARFNVLKNRGTENNFIGVPKTLFQLNKETQIAVIEIGTNAPGEIERLTEIVQPQAAIVTHIGHSHLEGLKSLEGVREEKLKVLKHLERGGTLFLNGEDPMLDGVQSGVHRIVRVKASDGAMLSSPLVGKHNLLNCALAVECAKALGLPPELVPKALASFKPVPGRLTLKNVGEIAFLDDSYNSNPSSFRAAIETLCSMRPYPRKGLVCGDMLELGPQSENLHREIGRLLPGSPLEYVVAAGKYCASLADEAVKKGFSSDKIFHVKDSAEAGKVCQKLARPGDLVLVKGSRGMQMEKIFDCFTNFSTR